MPLDIAKGLLDEKKVLEDRIAYLKQLLTFMIDTETFNLQNYKLTKYDTTMPDNVLLSYINHEISKELVKHYQDILEVLTRKEGFNG